MSSQPFHGVFPYLVSPIDDDGDVRTKVLAELCDDLIQAGVHGLTPLGSTGEFAYLSDEQKTAIVETVVQATAGRVPVLAGVAATTTSDAIDQTKRFVELGADGILAVMEAYFPVGDEGTFSYFQAIANAARVPVVLYTNPNFQRSDLSLAVIERLSEIENVVAIKDASHNTGRLLSILNRCGDRLDVFAASAHVPAAVMMLGGRGWMAGPACLVPHQSVALYDQCRAQRWDEAMALQAKLWRLNEAFERYNLAACVKGGLQLQGYDVGTPLAPQAPLSEEGRHLVGAILRDLGALKAD